MSWHKYILTHNKKFQKMAFIANFSDNFESLISFMSQKHEILKYGTSDYSLQVLHNKCEKI